MQGLSSWGQWIAVWASGCRVQVLGFRGQGSGVRIQGLGFRG